MVITHDNIISIVSYKKYAVNHPLVIIETHTDNVPPIWKPYDIVQMVARFWQIHQEVWWKNNSIRISVQGYKYIPDGIIEDDGTKFTAIKE
jgi:hypothetical protein